MLQYPSNLHEWSLVQLVYVYYVFSEPATRFYFWLVHGSDNSQIAPADAVKPKDTVMVTAFQTKIKLSIELFEGDETHTQQSAFGIFINGTVFDEDIDKMKQKLEAWWKSDGAYMNASSISIDIGMTEVFYSGAG